MANNPYPRRFEGFENLPADSSFVIVMNHYNRPGLHPYHCAMAVSVAVANRRPGRPELSWLLTSEWYGAHFGPIPVPVSLTRWTFSRIGRIYGLVVLPRREGLVIARASSLHHVLSVLAKAPIAITPEGAGSGHLIEPPAGSGLFLSILSQRGYPLYPLAVWEENSTFVLRVNDPFVPSLPHDLTRDEQDRLAREQAMVAIGRMLPREYWGVYAAAIERSLESERSST
jgi:1-acyl-sn-glycerol-3-phosphate acyltransferase